MGDEILIPNIIDILRSHGKIAVSKLAQAYGPLAQLVERYNGIVEVSGSTPLWSTFLR